MPSLPFQFSQSLGPCTGGGVAGDSLGMKIGMIGGSMLGVTIGGHCSCSVAVPTLDRQAEAREASVSSMLQTGKQEPSEVDEFPFCCCEV